MMEPDWYTWPRVTRDDDQGREWIHPVPPRFYLHQDKETKMWCVIDRTWDLGITKEYKRKHDCIRGFRSRMKTQLRLPLHKMR